MGSLFLNKTTAVTSFSHRTHMQPQMHFTACCSLTLRTGSNIHTPRVMQTVQPTEMIVVWMTVDCGTAHTCWQLLCLLLKLSQIKGLLFVLFGFCFSSAAKSLNFWEQKLLFTRPVCLILTANQLNRSDFFFSLFVISSVFTWICYQ